jgi:hypothetical protein
LSSAAVAHGATRGVEKFVHGGRWLKGVRG